MSTVLSVAQHAVEKVYGRSTNHLAAVARVSNGA
jgi:hypothetical protein